MRESSNFFKGIFDTSPLVLAAFPFGLIYGALAISIGLSPLVTLSMSLFVFAGSSQFIAISLLSSAASLPIILFAVFFVNIRHLLYAINFMPKVSGISQKYRFLMAFWLTDETFAVVSKYIEKNRKEKELMFYYFGSSIAMYFFWAMSSAIGIVFGQQVNNIKNWGLDIAMIIAFIGIVSPKLKSRPDWSCAGTALLSTIFTYHWPNQIGLSSFAGSTLPKYHV